MSSAHEQLHQRIQELVEGGQRVQLESVLENLSASDTARMLSDVPRETRVDLISLLEPLSLIHI